MKPFLLRLTFLVLSAAGPMVSAAPPFRLFEVSISRFTRAAEGRVKLELGLLNARGELRIVETHDAAMPPRTDERALGVPIVSLEAWYAFQGLGSQALANFTRLNDGLPVVLAGIPYYVVGPDSNAELNVGRVVNLATRGRASAADKLIGGFVIDEHHRRVLVRAVGPGLAGFGVPEAMADPFVTIFRGNLPLHFNGDWGQRPDATEVAQTAARVGAFALAPGSKDAALLIELPPGNYTAQVEPETGTAGTVLLEIYSVP